MSNRETPQKILIEYALAQLKQAIEDANKGIASKAANNLEKICKSISSVEQEKTNNEITEEEVEQKISEIAKKIK